MREAAEAGDDIPMLVRELQIAAGVMLRQLLHVLGRLHRQVVAHAGGDQNLLDDGDHDQLQGQDDEGH